MKKKLGVSTKKEEKTKAEAKTEEKRRGEEGRLEKNCLLQGRINDLFSQTQEEQAVVERVKSRKRTRSDPEVEDIPKKAAHPMNTTQQL